MSDQKWRWRYGAWSGLTYGPIRVGLLIVFAVMVAILVRYFL